jgi:hypothetical protein
MVDIVRHYRRFLPTTLHRPILNTEERAHNTSGSKPDVLTSTILIRPGVSFVLKFTVPFAVAAKNRGSV